MEASQEESFWENIVPSKDEMSDIFDNDVPWEEKKKLPSYWDGVEIPLLEKLKS